MITLQPPAFRPRRRRGARAELLLVGFNGIEATAGDLSVHVLFNTTGERPLQSVAAADPSKWTARWANEHYLGNGVYPVAYNELMIVLSTTGTNTGPNEITYAAGPSDIADVLGRYLAAFAGRAL
jgi:hypothetical protein